MASPQRIFSVMNAFQQTEALKAAIRLDLFTAIDNGARTAAELAKRCETSERGIRVLADYLVVIDFLKKDPSGYALSEDAKLFLSRNSPSFAGGAIRFLNSPTLMQAFENFDEVVRHGGTRLDGAGSVDPEDPVWVDFARSMIPMMQPAALSVAKMLGRDTGESLNVLDIAAGHGMFGIAVAKEYPHATVTALDWKTVLEVALENATTAGVQNRFRLLPGSAFEVDLPQAYDVILIPNFLHHFDIPTCETFLKKIHAALKDGGIAVTVEFVPNEDRVSPPVEAAFALVMLATTPSGDAYTFSQYERMFSASGFKRSEIKPIQMSPEHVILSQK